jgi:hypothetical protein
MASREKRDDGLGVATPKAPLSARPNRYISRLAEGAVTWPFAPDTHRAQPDSVYFGEVFEALDARLSDRGLTFVLARSVTDLPEAGPGTVAVIVGDEWCRWPTYAPRCLAVFKVFGTRPTQLSTVPFSVDLLYVVSALQRTRVTWKGLRTRLPRLSAAVRGRPTDNVFTIPVGSGHTVDLEVRPLVDRHWDIAFLGSVDNGNTGGWWRAFLESPKTVSRRSMMRELERLSRTRPDLKILTAEVDGFTAAVGSDPISYSQALADTKVALVPRGTNPETYRYLEAHRLGAIPVGEPLPAHPFYFQNPRYTVRRWRELTQVVERLLPSTGPSQAAEREQERVLANWRTTYAPSALADDMARTVLERLAVR